MKTKYLILIVLSWGFINYITYFYLIYIFVVFKWLFLSLTFLILFIYLISKSDKDSKVKSKMKIISSIVVLLLFLLEIYPVPMNSFIESMDWKYFYSERSEIVQKILDNEIKPKVRLKGDEYKLPFDLELISRGGEIYITRNYNNNSVTITFWVFRNFFESPSTKFVYTNDKTEIERINKYIKLKPNLNWKLEENWYRTSYD